MLLGLGGSVLGFLSFGASIQRPIDIQVASEANGYQTPAQKDAAAQAALKTQDTDGDGLSDYDEIYVYHTSPYLKDTDSDGIDDKTEVTNGTDPNCPAGKQCAVVSTGDASAGTTANASGTVPPPSAATGADLLQAANGMSAADIRALLKQANVPDANYANLDDASLRKLFVDTVQQAIDDGTLEKILTPASTTSAQATTGTSSPSPSPTQPTTP
jgi:hypothetical protein